MFDVSVKWDFEEPDKTIKGIMEKRAAAVKRARCPEHGGTPNNVTLRKVEGEYEVSFDPPCCDKLTDAARKAWGAS